jgi:hypothetical protein
MIFQVKTKVLAFAAVAIFATAAMADGVKLTSKWATSDYTYYDDPDHPTMIQCYKDPKLGPQIAEATSDDVVAKIASCPKAMRALCTKVLPAYSTDPVAACQIAALTVWVMENQGDKWYVFWRSSREKERSMWVETLLSFASAANDEYVINYFLDQVRWCGKVADADKVRAIGTAKASLVHVREVADMVADELSCQ